MLLPVEYGWLKATSADVAETRCAFSYVGCHGIVLAGRDAAPLGVTLAEAELATESPIDERATTVKV